MEAQRILCPTMESLKEEVKPRKKPRHLNMAFPMDTPRDRGQGQGPFTCWVGVIWGCGLTGYEPISVSRLP